MPRASVLSLAIASTLALAARAQAVIIFDNSPGATGRNTSAPAPGSNAHQGWFLQGQWGNYLGTPIGPNHFITALHAPGQSSANPFSFRGLNYTIDTSFGNNGLHVVPNSDLLIWKVNETFPEYAQIYNDASEASKPVTIYGRGTSRGAAFTSPNTVPPNSSVRGWFWGPHDNAGASVMSWGENVVGPLVSIPGAGEVIQFSFDHAGVGFSVANEAHLSDGDSGGGVFINDNGNWEIAGINYAVEGPFSFSSSGSDPFFGAIYDKGGLYQQNAAGNWQLNTDILANRPTTFVSSRLSPRAAYIHSVIQNANISQASYKVVGEYTVANVSVSDRLTLADFADPAKPGILNANHVRAAIIEMYNGGRINIRPNGTSAGVSRANLLTLSGAATIDVTNNALIVDSGDFAAIVASVRSGRNNGAWNGTGIKSSTAAENPHYGLAVIKNTDNGTTPLLAELNGQTSLPAAAVLVAYTLNGDSDLDFRITSDDYKRLDRGYANQHANPAKFLVYRWGDFNLDNTIDHLDYQLIDAAFQSQNPGQAPPLSPLRPVPEPTTLSLLAAATLLSTRRRR